MEQFEFSEAWMLVLVGALLLAGYTAHLLGGSQSANSPPKSNRCG